MNGYLKFMTEGFAVCQFRTCWVACGCACMPACAQFGGWVRSGQEVSPLSLFPFSLWGLMFSIQMRLVLEKNVIYAPLTIFYNHEV